MRNEENPLNLDSAVSRLKVIDNKSPWYKTGLKFGCTGCGKCCTGAPGYVWIEPEEILKMAEHLQLSVDEFATRYLRKVNGSFSLKERPRTFDCVFLEGKACSIYDLRPKQCRTFPWWVQNLQTPEDWEMAAKRCEGINHPDAPLVSFTHIQEQMKDGDGIFGK